MTAHGEGEFVLVPKEPTPEMIEAADALCPIARGTESHQIGGGVVPEEYYKAMLSAAPKSSGWRDISSAPKDGTKIMVWDTRAGFVPWVYWSTHNGDWMSEFIRWGGNPTHWQPLPLPPVEGEAK